MVRLSVGIEHLDDLQADLEQRWRRFNWVVDTAGCV